MGCRIFACIQAAVLVLSSFQTAESTILINNPISVNEAEAETEAYSEPETEGVTEAASEEPSEPETEEVTEAASEEPSEPETGEVTEAEREESSEAETGEVTEAESEESSEAETGEVTEAESEEPSEAETEEAAENEAYSEPETEGVTEAENEEPSEAVTGEAAESEEPAETADEASAGITMYQITEGISMEGFSEDPGFVFDGTKKTQDIHIYSNGKQLTENTDYTITYKNNINAAVHSDAKAPSMTIKLKGHYSGSRTFYFTIRPLAINDASVSAAENTVIKQGTKTFPAMTLFRNGTKLKAGTDFINPTVDGLKDRGVGTYTAIISGVGNYCGTREISYCIASKNNQDNFSKMGKVKLNTKSTVYYDGTEESAMPSVTVTIGKTIIDLSKDLTGTEYEGWFTVTYSGKNGEPIEQVMRRHGTAVITVTAKEESGFYGAKSINYKIDGSRTLSKTTVTGSKFWQDSIEYSEDKMTSDGIVQCSEDSKGLLVWNEDKSLLAEGEDYIINSYKNNKKAGTATVVFEGIGKYRGKYSKTFKITPGKQLYITMIGGEECPDASVVPKIPYTKNVTTPEIIVSADSEGTQILTNKKDYTITYSNNKEAGETATVTVKGKTNYKGAAVTKNFEIVEADIGALSIAVPDVKYNSKKPRNYASKPVITDINGKKLSAGKDYEREFVYSYDGMNAGKYPQVADTVTVAVTGKGNYTGTITGTYHIYAANKNISNLFFSFDAMTYTGDVVEPDYDDIHVYYTKKDLKNGINEITGEEEKSLYCITGYSNNIKSGSGKITLQGLGEYGGTKTYKFVISKKKYDYARVEKIAFQLGDNEPPVKMVTGEQRTLEVNILPENAENKVIIWSSSNKKIVSVKADEENTATAVLTANGAGEATIKAKSQDSGKTISCVVKVQKPALKLDKDMVKGKAGESVQLTAVITPASIQDSPIRWESSNENVATVTDKGVVTFVSGGAAVITASVEQFGLTARCFVTAKGELEKYVSVTDFGAVPNDGKDDTDAFEQAFAALGCGEYDGYDTVYVPEGTYHISPKYGIVMRDGTKLYMHENAVLQALKCSSSENQVIGVYVSDVEISGGTIIGELRAAGKAGEDGMGIRVQHAENVYIHDVKIKECRGDGIYIGGNVTGSTNVSIENCNVVNNSRNCLGIVSAHNIYVEGCQFMGAGSIYGTLPKCCILIEKNGTDNICTDIVIKNSYIDNKAVCSSDSNASAFASAWVNWPNAPIIQGDRLTVENCTFKGKVVNYSVKNAKFINCKFDGETIFKQGTIVK